MLKEQGRYVEAETIARAAVAYYERGGTSPVSSIAVAQPRRDLATVLVSQGRWEAVLEQYRILRAQLRDDELYRGLIQTDVRPRTWRH